MTPKIHIRVHKSPPLVHILNWTRSVNTVTFCVGSILVLPRHRFSGLLIDFPITISYAFRQSLPCVLHTWRLSSLNVTLITFSKDCRRFVHAAFCYATISGSGSACLRINCARRLCRKVTLPIEIRIRYLSAGALPFLRIFSASYREGK